MKRINFGTDGWRALMSTADFLNDNALINVESVEIVAQAFADYLRSSGKPVNGAAVGFDGRRNSELFAGVFASVLSGNSINVFLSDRICPTPLLSFYTKHFGLDAGVMITASHNPPEYNGIKFKAAYGGPFLTEDTLMVEKLLAKSKVVRNNSLVSKVDFFPPYIEHLRKEIDIEMIRKSKLSVLVDSMGGAGENLIEAFFSNSTLPNDPDFRIKTIFAPANELFYGRFAEPIEKNLTPLKSALMEGKYSMGLATDGDADRLGVMLENGEWLSAQETILLLSDFAVNKKNLLGAVVKTSSVTDKISQLFYERGRKVLDVQVGFKYICEEMISGDVAFGGEESGGFGFANHLPERDGIFSALIFIEMVAGSGYSSLSDYVNIKRKEFGKIFYSRIDHHYYEKDISLKLPKLLESPPTEIAGFPVKSVQKFYGSHRNVNGIKFYLEGKPRWLLIRVSETEPMFRFYAEGENDSEVFDLLETGKNLIQGKKIAL